MIMPNFLVIGAQKAGTTSLYHYLKQHPQIYMSPVKEPGFFEFEGKQPNFCGPSDRNVYRRVTTTIEAYCDLFKEAHHSDIAIGEASTWYLYSQKAPERIKHYIPNAKLIAILRNPVDRAYSGFMHTIRDGRESLTDFSRALREEKKRIERNWEYLWHYKSMGFYSVQLKRYYDLFDRNQLKVYLYEDLATDPTKLMEDIFQFLEVDEKYVPEAFSRINVSGICKNQFLGSLLKSKNSLTKNLVKPFLPPNFRIKLSNYIRKKIFVKPQLSPEVRREVIELYREDILNLQEIIQRDLSKWLD